MAAMPTALRDSGITVIGDVPWGGHFSIFYETRSDLLDTVAQYFRAGLANNEACLWIISDPLKPGVRFVEELRISIGISQPET